MDRRWPDWDKTITAELVDANLGVQSPATDRALTDVANDLIDSYGDCDDADASLDESVAEDSGGWLGSIGSEAARQAFSATLSALATGDGPDGFVAAHLNRARAEADGRAAAKRLPGPGALLLLGDELSGVVRLAPRAPGADPARQEATRSPWPRLKVTLVAVAAVGILAALALAAWALRRWLLL